MIALANGGKSLNPEDSSSGEADGRTPLREVFDAAIHDASKKEPELEVILTAARDAALRISQENSLVNALIALVPLLKEPERTNTLDAAYKTTGIITDHDERAEALTSLAPLLKESERESALNGAFDAAINISHDFLRTRALAELIPLLSGAERATAVQIAFETAMAVAKADPESGSVVLPALINFVGEPERDAALTTLFEQALTTDFEFSSAVRKHWRLLTPRLVSALFQTAMSISDDRVRASILTKLAASIGENRSEIIASTQVDESDRMSAYEDTALVNIDTLSLMRGLAESEGRDLQSLIEEAFTDLLEKRKQSKPRPHVMAAYQASHERFGSLYKKLAE